MKLKMFKKLVCAGLLSSSILFSGTSEAGIVTDRFPLTCYVDHHVDTFDKINGSRVGYIDANVDWIKVYEYRDGWVRASYNGLRSGYTRWFRVNEICADTNYSNRGVNVRGAQTVYTTKDSNNKLGSVSNNESVIVLADNGNRAQILYRLDNGSGYKMGWVPSSSVASGGGNKTKGDINGDGRVDETDVALLKEHWENDRGYIPEGDMDSNGKIDIYDVMKITEDVYDKPKTNPIPSKLKELVNKWKGQIWTNGTFSGYDKDRNPKVARECKEFAAYIFGLLYLDGKGYYSGGYIGGSKTNYDIYNQNRVGCRGIKPPRMTLSGVKELFQNAQPGDFIQMQRAYKNSKGNYGPHSAILYEKTNDGIWFFEANAPDADGSNYEYNKIKLTFHSYENLVEKNQAMSVYYAK